MHAITDNQEDRLLNKVYEILKVSGKFFIETRTIRDHLYGLGENVGNNAYIYNNHYRRFINKDSIVHKLKLVGFNIIYAEEGNDWAVYKEENPIVLRIIAKK